MFPNSLENRNNHLNAGSIQFSQMTAGIFENPDVSLLITPSKIHLELNDSENVVRVPTFIWSIFLIFPEFFFLSFFFSLFQCFFVLFCFHVMIRSYPEIASVCLILPLSSSVTLKKLVKISMPQFPL